VRRRCLLRLVTAVCFLSVLQVHAIQRGDRVAILPFENHSDFPGTWDLSRGLPEQLAASLQQTLDLVVVPFDSVTSKTDTAGPLTTDQYRSIGEALGADLVLTGNILDFSIKRFSVGNPFVAGYASYTTLVDLEIRLLRTFPGATRVESFRGKAEEAADDLGLTLLGKPSQSGAVHKQLNDVPFGGTVFSATLIGKATHRSLQQIVDGLATRILNETVALKARPRILSLEGRSGFVNLGIADKMEPGHRFLVRSHIDSQIVGAIQIIAPLAEHLSQIRVTEGEQDIRENDLLRAPRGR
jgi:hypothetical protein